MWYNLCHRAVYKYDMLWLTYQVVQSNENLGCGGWAQFLSEHLYHEAIQVLVRRDINNRQLFRTTACHLKIVLKASMFPSIIVYCKPFASSSIPSAPSSQLCSLLSCIADDVLRAAQLLFKYWFQLRANMLGMNTENVSDIKLFPPA